MGTNGTDGDCAMVIFKVCDTLHAISASVVDKVETAALVNPLPGMPGQVLGVLDFHGEILSVVSARIRLGFPGRELRSSDRMIVARTATRRLILVVDDVLGVRYLDKARVSAASSFSDEPHLVAGAERTDDCIVLIHDLDSYLGELDIAELGEI